jgi:putative protease
MTKALARIPTTRTTVEVAPSTIELLCPVDNLVGLRAAVDNGADGVLLDCRTADEIPGSIWIDGKHSLLTKGIRYAHDRHCRVALRLEAHPKSTSWPRLRAVIDQAGCSGVDALVLSDPALMLYAADRYPELQLHYAAPSSALHPESINYFQQQIGISRIVLPPGVSLAHVRQIANGCRVDIEVIGFGPHCTIVGVSPLASGITNMEETDAARCATTDEASNDLSYVIRGFPDTSALRLLPNLKTAGVRAIRIEARDGNSGRLAQVTRIWREAIDSCLENVDRYSVKQSWLTELNRWGRQAIPH